MFEILLLIFVITFSMEVVNLTFFVLLFVLQVFLFNGFDGIPFTDIALWMSVIAGLCAICLPLLLRRLVGKTERLILRFHLGSFRLVTVIFMPVFTHNSGVVETNLNGGAEDMFLFLGAMFVAVLVGVITSFLGAPFFLYILRYRFKNVNRNR